MTTNTDYDFLTALARTLSEDDTLFNMADGKFEIDYPAKKVASNLTGSNQTMISVSAPNIVSGAMMGYDHSGRVRVTAMLQVDVASIKGNNMKYCREVADRVKVLIEGDVTKTLDQTYNIYVDRINDNSFYDEELGCWHTALIIYAEYIKSSK